LHTDLCDGVKLINFLEILGDKRLQKKIDLNPASRIQKIQNCVLALEFMEKELAVKNSGCSAEDVVDADTRGIKLVLGLLWTLYRKYRIAVIKVQDKSSEEGLLLWCKTVTDGYKGVNIENFKNSFKDGLAFLAMIHRFNPDKTGVKFDQFSPDHPEQNLGVAFDLAEKELGIPKLLDVHEVMDGKVDERSLVLYTSLFFHAYRAAQVAEGLLRDKASTEELLARARKENEDLRAKNTYLEEQLALLKLQLDEQRNKHHTTETDLEFEKKKVVDLNSKVVKLSEEIRLSAETNLKILSDKNKLEHDLKDINAKLESEIKMRLDKEKSASQSQQEDSQKITDLKKKHSVFEEEIESLKQDVEGFKVQLDNERKDKDEQTKVFEDHTNQDGVKRRGLGVIKHNLNIHIEDLHTWQQYLGTKDKSTFNFDQDVRRVLEEELQDKDFITQLEMISGRLEVENETMLKILKLHKAESKAAQLVQAQNIK